MSHVIGRGRYARAVYPVAKHASGGVDDHKVLVSATDTTPGYLQEKLAAGFNIQLNLLNAGGNEQLEIASNPC